MASTITSTTLEPEPQPSRNNTPTPTPRDLDALGMDESRFVLPPLSTLSEREYLSILKSIGATRPDDPSQPVEIASSSPFFPHRHLPHGLYRDIVLTRRASQLSYYISSIFYSAALVLQLLFGAVLTALGSSSNKNGLAITILAAANTVNAGLIALFNNTGMPDRFWNDWNEFEDVEMYVRELIETGLVDTGKKKEEVVAGCFVRFQAARQTVRKNKPASYNGTSQAAKGGVSLEGPK